MRFFGKSAAAGALALLALGIVGAPAVFAAEEKEAGLETMVSADKESPGYGIRIAGIAIGAALAIGVAGLGTGRAQAGVGSAGIGALAEKPELLANVLLLYVIPETIVVFGFVMAFLILQLA
jgi:V/A-type H+-transporting ATPase subunit K